MISLLKLYQFTDNRHHLKIVFSLKLVRFSFFSLFFLSLVSVILGTYEKVVPRLHYKNVFLAKLPLFVTMLVVCAFYNGTIILILDTGHIDTLSV